MGDQTPSDDVVTCDDCSELVATEVATVQGTMAHPEEVLCPNCAQESDRQ